MAKRLRDVCKMNESEPRWLSRLTDAFVVRDLPWSIEKLRALPHFEFENWAVIALGGAVGNDIVLVPVPEPTTFAAFALAGVAMLGRRRRAKRGCG